MKSFTKLLTLTLLALFLFSCNTTTSKFEGTFEYPAIGKFTITKNSYKQGQFNIKIESENFKKISLNKALFGKAKEEKDTLFIPMDSKNKKLKGIIDEQGNLVFVNDVDLSEVIFKRINSNKINKLTN